jgi:hypothetical protein
MLSAFKKVVLASTLSLVSTSAFADNSLSSIKLNQASGTAEVCSTVEIFKNNEIFSHQSYSGYVIKISGSNSIFDGLASSAKICLAGPYKIDSKGFAPHLNISQVEVSRKQESATVVKKASVKLSNLVEEIGTKWRDNNITTGTSVVTLGNLSVAPTVSTGKQISEKNFRAEYNRLKDSKLSLDVKLKTVARAFSIKDIDVAAAALGKGNAYSPEYTQGLSEFKADLKTLLSNLGETADLITLTTSATIEEDGEATKVYSMMFVNKKTLIAIKIFVVEGRM